MTGPHFPRGARALLPMALLAIGLAGCDQATRPAPVMSGTAATTSAPGGSMVTPTGLRPPGLEGRPHPDQIVVQRDETLYEVSRRYDVPIRAIIDANKLQPPYRLLTGQTLTLPKVRVHYVLAGDTLYSVSRLWGVDMATLVELNHMQPPYTLITGSTLLLPPQVAPPVTASGGQRQGQGQGAFTATPLAAPSTGAPGTAAPPPAVAAVPPPAPSPPPPSAASPAPFVQGPPPTSSAPIITSQPPSSAPPAAAPPASTTPAPASPPQSAALPPPPPRGGHGFLWPVHGRVINGYGTGAGGTHNDGINIAAPEGTTVVAADSGTVAYAGNELRGYGNLILIKHADGWMTAYAHNAQLLVKRGDRVQRGQAIARVGATGAVGAPQLHFEVRKGTRALDPADFLSPASSG